MIDTPTPWRVEATCTRYLSKRLYQLRLRDDDNRIVCFGFGRNPTAAYLRLSTHAGGVYFPAGNRQDSFRSPNGFSVIAPKELPLALLALERYLDKK